MFLNTLGLPIKSHFTLIMINVFTYRPFKATPKCVIFAQKVTALLKYWAKIKSNIIDSMHISAFQYMESFIRIRCSHHKLWSNVSTTIMPFQAASDNHSQKCWDTLHRVVYISPPLPLYNVDSSIFAHSHVEDPNIAWWGRGRYGMLEDSLAFMSKKPRFQHVKINVNTVKLIHHFGVSVPTTFDEHCLWKC